MKIRAWKKSNATDQDIRNCLGDFIGCTECRYFKRCHELLFEEIKNECKGCEAWSGTDCTRHPYEEGCLKDNGLA